MSSAFNLLDYCAQYFEDKDLTKILGGSGVDSILKLLRECEHNAQSLYTTLGGGKLGYLVVWIEAVYDNVVPGTAMSRP